MSKILKKVGAIITAFSVFISIIVAIDYFCRECLRNFLWAHFSFLLTGLIVAIALLILVIATVSFLRKWQQNQYDIEEPEGQVPLNSPFYIKRPPIESECYRMILKNDALIRIKAPRQMGKSSLMTRILHHAKEKGHCRTLSLSLQEADSTIFANLEHFLQWLCTSVTEQLELPDKVEEYWQNKNKKRLGNKRCCSRYFKDYLLTEIKEPIVLGLDEVDRIFQEQIATDFFGLLRTWHENGKNDKAWQRFRLVITHSQEVYISLDINQSPFNVGTAIELPEFNREQVQTLAQRHKRLWTEEVDQLMAIVGGHPYLIRVALYKIAREQFTLEKLLKTAANEKGPYAEHLNRQLANLQAHPQLATIFKTIITSDNPIPINKELNQLALFKLGSLGLIKIEENKVKPWCELYRRYFNHRLNTET